MSAQPQRVAPPDAESAIMEGLLYLEREASQAHLGCLATVIRAAVDVYRRDTLEEDTR